jgi:DNA polymerase V
MKKYPAGSFIATKSKKKIPVALSSLSAGAPEEITDDYELLDVNDLITGGREGIVSYRVDGDSMREDIKHGDFVFVDPYCEPQTGDTIVSRINGKNNIKIYEKNNNGLFLVPKNKDYKPQKISKLDDFHILGVVLWHLGCDKRK